MLSVAGTSALRCAQWAHESGITPTGTAPQTDVFVLVEHPLPWPRDVEVDPAIAAIVQSARAAIDSSKTVRVQALVPTGDSPTRKVIVFRAGRPFRGYERLDGAATPDRVPDVVARLLAAENGTQPAGGVTDVLVCTHGTRDTCCGSLGTRLIRDLVLSGVNVWRTSHTGGHRFAPTAITFPDGNYWAHLTADLLPQIVDRTLDPEVASRHLRGSAAFSPAAQVADCAIFAQRGWDWLVCDKFEEDHGPLRVGFCFQAPDGATGCYRVSLASGQSVPIPSCPVDGHTSQKTQTELCVSGVQLLT